MENENMTPVPAQPVYQPPVQPQDERPVQPEAPAADTMQYQTAAQPQSPAPEQPPVQPKKKKKAWKIVLPVAACVLALAAAACVYFLCSRAPSVEKVELADSSVYLKTGDSYALGHSFEPADAAVSERVWTSSDEAVATVREGTVTAVAEGSCMITLQIGEAYSKCRVVVAAPPEEGGNIVGTWRFDGAFISDVYHDGANGGLTVCADGRAELRIDGVKTGLSWRSTYSADGVEFFDVVADDGTRSEFWYYAEAGGDYAGKLVLYGNDENMLIFTK